MKKHYGVLVLFAIFFTLVFPASAQEAKCDSVYNLAEQMPVYGKGHKEFNNYLNKNLEVKKPCKPSDLKRLIFVVNKDGKVSDIEVVGVAEKCKEDIIRQLKGFPDWTPGMDQGQPVCVRIILPIILKLHREE